MKLNQTERPEAKKLNRTSDPEKGGSIMDERKAKTAHDQLRDLLKARALNETYYQIKEVAYLSHELHVTQADTIKIIREYFDEMRQSHRLWWITDIVREGRKMAEDDWHDKLSKLRKIPITSEDEQGDSDPGPTAEDVASPPRDDTAIKLLKSYFGCLNVNNAASFIGKASCKAYSDGLSTDQTVKAIEEYFFEHDLFHRHNWIKNMVIGARNFAKRSEVEDGQW